MFCADEETGDFENDEAEARWLSNRIRSAMQQADAFGAQLMQLQSTKSDNRDDQGGNEGSRDTMQQAVVRRVSLAVEYCKARLARLQAKKDAMDGGAAEAAERVDSAQKPEL